MIVSEIRKIAKSHGLKTSGIKKAEMIKAIQIHEGNFDCFASATDGFCDQGKCIWRADCLELATKNIDNTLVN